MQTAIFIHGLGGSSGKTWLNFPQLIASDNNLSLETDCFDYPSSLFRFPFQRKLPSIQTLSRGLRSYIKAHWSDADRIILICHSLGGLIARQYLLEETKAERPTKIHKLVMLATPNNGADLARVGKLFSWRHNQLRQLCRESEFVQGLNDDWADLRMKDRFDTLYIVAGQDNIVRERSAKQMWGTGHFDVAVGKTHRGIAKPDNNKDIVFLLVKQFILSPPTTVVNLTRNEVDRYSVELALVLDFITNISSGLPSHAYTFGESRRAIDKLREIHRIAVAKFEAIRRLLPEDTEKYIEHFIQFFVKNYLSDLDYVLPLPGKNGFIANTDKTKEWRYKMLTAWDALQNGWIDVAGISSKFKAAKANNELWKLIGFSDADHYQTFISPDTQNILTRGNIQDRLLAEYIVDKKSASEQELLDHGFSKATIVELFNAMMRDELLKKDYDNHIFTLSELGTTAIKRFLSSPN